MQNAEYEIGVLQTFFYIIAVLHLKILNILNILNTFDREYCFVKLHTLRQTESFQRQYELYMKPHRRRIVVETTSRVRVDNSVM